MHTKAILHEAQQLHNVSDRLDSLAEQHPQVSAALITISASVRNTATLLEVLVATKNSVTSGIRSGECLICSPLSGSFEYRIVAAAALHERLFLFLLSDPPCEEEPCIYIEVRAGTYLYSSAKVS